VWPRALKAPPPPTPNAEIAYFRYGTRENLIKQASSLTGERLPMILPGVSISTKPGDYTPFRTLRIATFDGESWSLTGEPLSAD
jgi:branched-chain amino acid transport system substrate-binding protein